MSDSREVRNDTEAFDDVFDPSVVGGFFLAYDNSDPAQLWVWRGDPADESAEPWQQVIYGEEATNDGNE